MSPIIWAAIAAVVVVAVLWRLLSPSIERVVSRAVAAKDVGPVVTAISKQKSDAQPTLYNLAIRRLWDSYERELATELIKKFAEQHHTTSIAQYWLQQVAQTEPNLATQILTKPFFDSYFLPEVAAKCGKAG